MNEGGKTKGKNSIVEERIPSKEMGSSSGMAQIPTQTPKGDADKKVDQLDDYLFEENIENIFSSPKKNREDPMVDCRNDRYLQTLGENMWFRLLPRRNLKTLWLRLFPHQGIKWLCRKPFPFQSHILL